MKRLKPTTILEYVLLILLAGLFLFPMIWMVVSAMKPEADVYKSLTSWKAFLPSFNPADWFKPYQEVLSRFSILREQYFLCRNICTWVYYSKCLSGICICKN